MKFLSKLRNYLFPKSVSPEKQLMLDALQYIRDNPEMWDQNANPAYHWGGLRVTKPVLGVFC